MKQIFLNECYRQYRIYCEKHLSPPDVIMISENMSLQIRAEINAFYERFAVSSKDQTYSIFGCSIVLIHTNDDSILFGNKIKAI